MERFYVKDEMMFLVIVNNNIDERLSWMENFEDCLVYQEKIIWLFVDRVFMVKEDIIESLSIV